MSETVKVSAPEPKHFDLPDADIVLYEEVFGPDERAGLFESLRAQIAWEQHEVTVFGRTLPAPRLSAWYGDPGAAYRYSGVALEPLPWIGALAHTRDRVERLASTRFNSVLANLYRDGADAMGAHADDEPELGPAPDDVRIASVSLGAARRFLLRHRDSGERRELALGGGDVLVMGGPLQRTWTHRVARTRRSVGRRLSLTFRFVRRPAVGC